MPLPAISAVQSPSETALVINASTVATLWVVRS
jgi:hypothetical protein